MTRLRVSCDRYQTKKKKNIMSPNNNGTDKPRVVLAYSGGLDTSVILTWLIEKGFDVICYCANVGQEESEFPAVKAKALAAGAIKVYVEDLRRDFVENYVFLGVKANAIYEQRYMLGTSLARPCIAKRQVEIAQKEGAKYLAHGATGKGNDQVRFEMCQQALDSSLKTIVPWREKEFLERFKGRADLMAYATAHGIEVDATPKAPWSMDDNLYHVSFESGILEDPMQAPPADMFRMTDDPQTASATPEKIRIDFKDGAPVKVGNLDDGTEVEGSLELFLYLNRLAKKHGIGRIDIVENRFVGIKSRGVYETPGGTILREAHLDMESLTMDREVRFIRDQMSMEFSRSCYNGFWFAPEMDFMRNSIEFSQRNVTGSVYLRLYRGVTSVVGRESPFGLYSEALASMDIDTDGGEGFNFEPSDSAGFININSVRLKAYDMQKKAVANQTKTCGGAAEAGSAEVRPAEGLP